MYSTLRLGTKGILSEVVNRFITGLLRSDRTDPLKLLKKEMFGGGIIRVYGNRTLISRLKHPRLPAHFALTNLSDAEFMQ